MDGARTLDGDRYVDPLSPPALAWSLQHGDNATRWLWHAGALHRYKDGVYRRDGERWASDRLRQIVVGAAEQAAAEATDRIAQQGRAWEAAVAALDLLARVLPGDQARRLLGAAEEARFWPTPERVRQDIEGKYTIRGLVEPVIAALVADTRAATAGAAVDANLDFVNCANGLLDLRDMTLHPHSPDFLSTIQLPVAYDPNADCQRFGQFLDQVLAADTVAVVQELLGYALVPDVRYQQAFLLLGAGANGKSVLLDVLRALVGPHNCSATPLQNLTSDKFAAATLVGKTLNLCADLSATTQKSTSVLKEVVAGDTMVAQEKHRQPFTFRPFARLIFSANEAPGTTDASHGFWRRWVTIPFPRIFGTGEGAVGPQDRNLTAKLLAELPGILNYALVGLVRLRAQGGFSESESCAAALEGYRRRTDSVLEFLADACEKGPQFATPKAALYSSYQDFCNVAGREPLGRTRFYERISATPGIAEARGDNRARVWAGVRVSPHEAPLPRRLAARGWDE